MFLGECFKKYFIIIVVILCCGSTAYCEILTLEQKYIIFNQYLSNAQLPGDIYCFLNSKVFDIYFNLEFAQNTKEIKSYYDSIVCDFYTKDVSSCGCYHSDECKYSFNDRFRMLKRLFHAESYGFLLHCKNRLTNSMINKSFEQGNILELYFRLSQEFEF